MIQQQIAEILLELKAVTINTTELVTWASGIKSPIYCDNRIIISHPKERNIIAQAFANQIKKFYPNTDYIAGTATAGIPHAAWVADILELPMIYVRSSAKEHGKGNQIEGKIQPGAHVVLIEDLFSTGMSSIAACQALREAKMNLLGVHAIFSYQLKKCQTNFLKHNIEYHSLSDINALIELAIAKNLLQSGQITILNTFFRELDK